MAMDQPRDVTPRERVAAAYKGQRADRVPAYPIAGSFAGCLDGLSIEEYCTNPTRAARAMLNYYERYQPDIMIAFNDLAKEAEAVGCRVKYSDYVVPSIDRHVLQDDKGRLARLEIPDPRKDGRLPAFLEQCEALSSAKLPSRLGAVLVGPWTIAMLLRNPELMCLDTIDDPEFVHELKRLAYSVEKRISSWTNSGSSMVSRHMSSGLRSSMAIVHGPTSTAPSPLGKRAADSASHCSRN